MFMFRAPVLWSITYLIVEINSYSVPNKAFFQIVMNIMVRFLNLWFFVLGEVQILFRHDLRLPSEWHFVCRRLKFLLNICSVLFNKNDFFSTQNQYLWNLHLRCPTPQWFCIKNFLRSIPLESVDKTYLKYTKIKMFIPLSYGPFNLT